MGGGASHFQNGGKTGGREFWCQRNHMKLEEGQTASVTDASPELRDSQSKVRISCFVSRALLIATQTVRVGLPVCHDVWVWIAHLRMASIGVEQPWPSIDRCVLAGGSWWQTTNLSFVTQHGLSSQ